jgi:DmsE family decaheme c-type cytochrome
MRRLLIILLIAAAPSVLAEAACEQCHAEAASAMTGTPHGEASCGACHGDAAGHPGAGALMSFTDEAADQRSAACEGCHRDARSAAINNPHAQSGLACNDCHQAHGPAPEPAPVAGFPQLPASSAGCYGCHEDTFAQFALSERHRLDEGAISCTSCHDPHGAEPHGRLGGFDQSSCGECHANTGGPFVFEHAASRVEGCGACHEPHGSPNRHLLNYQRVAELCFECHATVPQFHSGFSPVAPPRFDTNTVCTNCHVAIHGSNLDRNLLR